MRYCRRNCSRNSCLERHEPGSRTRDAYVLWRNVFVVLDPDLKQAMDVVRCMRAAPCEARRAFVRNPRPVIAEAIGGDAGDAGDALAASLFVETQQYSERVLGRGVWERPALPCCRTIPGSGCPKAL